MWQNSGGYQLFTPSVKRSLEKSKAGKKRVKSKLNLEVKTKGKGKFRKG